ncbi:RNA ligase-domain-containing protein [Ephemerocybe angulata]|uniref:RNA ligase-domain-containing protein n=1 Tax=Ephemerocybe angulata TaxID=980116 RepID=A0A8H6HWP0_9AGAR|nr:RNA ligase-domain-containing protein [Tulosesus angulatus]
MSPWLRCSPLRRTTAHEGPRVLSLWRNSSHCVWRLLLGQFRSFGSPQFRRSISPGHDPPSLSVYCSRWVRVVSRTGIHFKAHIKCSSSALDSKTTRGTEFPYYSFVCIKRSTLMTRDESSVVSGVRTDVPRLGLTHSLTICMSSRTFTFLSLNTLHFRFRPNSIDLRIRTANRITQGQGSVRSPSFSTMSSATAQTIAQALDDSHLIDSLIALSRKSPKLVRSTEAAVPGCESISVRSWKMNEFKYHDIPLPFPTLARGLFTTELGEARRESEGDKDVRHRIVVRGYDKFFNIGEVPWTTWEAIERHTCAPYVLSLKSNGCIIFIAAVTPEKLVVTSKHSLGNADEVLGPKGNGKAPVSHAGVGRRWLGRYLEAKGRTEADLARVLWDNRWTAVAELCDDSFEEHVLPYPPSKTGLHLHGLNVSSGPFETLSHSVVDAFAEDWGFIRTATITLSSIGKVREFTSKIAETGKWNDEAVEGFVVRTHVSTPPTETKKNKTVSRDQSPYTYGSDFFFKIKFDEPYMMYRDWREVTKTLLSVRDKQGVSKMGLSVLPKSRTEEYVGWVVLGISRAGG